MTDVGPSSLDRSRVLEGATKLLADGVPRRAKDIASALSKSGAWVDKSLVNSVLSKEGKEQFSYDRITFSYRLIGSSEAAADASEGSAAPTAQSENAPHREAVLVAALRLLSDGKPRSAKEIAAELKARGLAGLDKSLVNSVLSREGKGQVEYSREDHTYRQTQTSGDQS